MSSKKYFQSVDSEGCYSSDYFQDLMELDDLNEIEVFQAVIIVGLDHFWCSNFGMSGEVGEGCGKECDHYSPRNRKSGRCRHSSNLYEHGDIVILKRKKARG